MSQRLSAGVLTMYAAVASATATSALQPHLVSQAASPSIAVSGAVGPSQWAQTVRFAAEAWNGGLSSTLTNLLISGWIIVLVVEWAVRSREAKRELSARRELLVEVVMNIRIVLEDVQGCPNWLADALVRDYLLLPELRQLVLGSRALGIPTHTRMRLLSLMKAVDLVDGVYSAQRGLAIRLATGEQLVDGLWEQMEQAFRRSTAEALVLARDCESRLTRNPDGPIQVTTPLVTCGACGTQQQVDRAVVEGKAAFRCLYCGAETSCEDLERERHSDSGPPTAD